MTTRMDTDACGILDGNTMQPILSLEERVGTKDVMPERHAVVLKLVRELYAQKGDKPVYAQELMELALAKNIVCKGLWSEEYRPMWSIWHAEDNRLGSEDFIEDLESLHCRGFLFSTQQSTPYDVGEIYPTARFASSFSR